MADIKISGLPVATAIASPDVAPIVQGGVTKQADVGLFAGLSGSISDQQIAFANGMSIAGSDDFKWVNDDTALEIGSSSFPIADVGNIRVPKAFKFNARNSADDGNVSILEKKVTSGHDNLIIGDASHANIELSGAGNNTFINAESDGSIQIRAMGGGVTLYTNIADGFGNGSQGDFEITGSGWLSIQSQTRANLISTHGASPFEGVFYTDSSDHHAYFYNGTAFVQLDNENIIFPDSDPHVAGAGYWSAGVLTRSNG